VRGGRLQVAGTQRHRLCALRQRLLRLPERVERSRDGGSQLAVAGVDGVRPAVLDQGLAQTAADLEQAPQGVVQVGL